MIVSGGLACDVITSSRLFAKSFVNPLANICTSNEPRLLVEILEFIYFSFYLILTRRLLTSDIARSRS